MKFFSFVLLLLFFSNVKAQNLGNGISDIDGNSYKTIIIGDQEWMGENLKTSKYNDGSTIPNVTDSALWVSLVTGAWVHYNNDEKFNSIYGKLYNGFVIRKDKNVCPSGWHIPKANDFEDLVNFLGGDTIAGEKLKELDTTLWYSPYEASVLISSITTLPTNSSNFAARPGGVVYNRWGFDGMRWGGFFWGETAEDTNSAHILLLIHYTKGVTLAGKGKENGFSIRCMKDQVEGSVNSLDCEKKFLNGVVLEQSEVSNVTIELPYFGGNGGYFDKQEINSNGVTGLTATLERGKLKEGDSTLTFNISGKTSGYGVAVFDLNFLGQSCKLELPVEQVLGKYGDGVTDIEGNQYKTVIIGNQEWMGQNLKTTKYNDGQVINNLAENDLWQADSIGGWCNYQNDQSFDEIYGKLYNWHVINPKFKKNVCPVGWHVPTVNDWGDLIRYLGDAMRIDGSSTYPDLSMNFYESNKGGMLKSTDFWMEPNIGANNSTYFNGLPAGIREIDGKYGGKDLGTFFWSQSEQKGNDILAYRTHLYTNGTYLTNESVIQKSMGFSIRCLKDQFEGSVNSIDCEKKSINGAVLEQTEVSNVTIELPYFGGNGFNINQMVINSSGIEGLVATLKDELLKEGDSTLTFNISGKTSGYGVAVFDLNFLSQSCKVELPVEQVLGKYGDGVTDIEGNQYKTVIIGNQEWMGENLSVGKYNDGKEILNIVEDSIWKDRVIYYSSKYWWTIHDFQGAWCYYDNKTSINDKNGKLYNLYAAHKNVCPTGWHVPKVSEWHQLIDFLGGKDIAGMKIKDARRSYGWNNTLRSATNSSLFSALGVGIRVAPSASPDASASPSFFYKGVTSLWWSGDTNIYNSVGQPSVVTFHLDVLDSGIYESIDTKFSRAGLGSSIRCIKDSPDLQGNINSLECDSAVFSGQLLKDQSTIGANFKVPYSGGNGGTYNEQNVTSVGVSGLIATLKAGNFENGIGVLTYEVSGTPISSGVASFEINVGGKSCLVNQNVCGLYEKIDSVQTCQKYQWKGNWLTSSGKYSDTLKYENNCDTVETLVLTVLSSVYKVESITACDPYQWHDSIYSASGTYTFNYVNTNGCPLTDTLVLMYSQPLDLVITGDSVVRVGDSIRWTSNLAGIWGLNSTYHAKIDSLGWIHGLNEGDAEVTLYVNSDLGCGNHLTKSLKVLPAIDPCSEVKNKVDSLFVCQSVEWNGALYSQSGVYAKTYQTTLGCNVTDTLVLNVYPSENKIDTLAVCGSTEWHGERYSVSGVYSKTYQNTYGCSVTDTLILEIKPSQNRVESITACDPYVWYDSTYTESGTYTHTYQNAHGCTLTDTLVLLYSKPLNLVITGDSVVRVGDSIRWTSNLPGIWGLNSSYHAKIDSLGWIHGLNEGDSEVTLYVNSELGCGNHLTKSLKVLPAIDPCSEVKNKVDSLFVCQSVEWNGALYSQSGVYAKTYQTTLGCNVTDTLVLNIYPSENKFDSLAVCGSTEWHGERYSVSGVYSKTYQNTYGCSVTDTLILEIKPSQNRVESITACDPYVWYDSTYTESGTYTHTYQNVHGCTLTDTLVLLYSKPLNLVITGDSVVRVGDSIRWTSNLPGIWGLNSTYHVKIDSLGWINGLNEGDAEVTLYVNSDLGCGNHLTKSLKVLPAIDLCKDFYAAVSSFEDNTSDSSKCNGKIQIEQKGGKLPVSYLWNTGSTKPIGEFLCEGDYLITLTDANLCSTVLKTTISKISTKETSLDIEITTTNATSIQSCDGSVTINVKNGTAPFYFDNVISSTYSRNSLCAGLYTVEVSDAKGLKSTLPYLISAPETTINTENKLLKDSTSVDTLKAALLKNCDIDLTKVDSVKIKEYLPVNNSMIVITWGIYSNNTTQFVTHKYKVDKGSGVYTALLEMYCKEEKRQIPSLQVAEKFYFRSTGNSTASVIQKEQRNNLRVYPNPFTDEVEIGLDYPQDFQLEIIGVDGHRLLIEKYTNQKIVRLNLGELANGVYLVKVSNSNFVQEKMIIK